MAQNEGRRPHSGPGDEGVHLQGSGQAMSIDWEAYLPFIEDPTIPEDQKRDLIETLWSITLAFVDLGFGLHPVQQSCGQGDDALAPAIRSVVGLRDQAPPTKDMPSAQWGAVAGKESQDED